MIRLGTVFVYGTLIKIATLVKIATLIAIATLVTCGPAICRGQSKYPSPTAELNNQESSASVDVGQPKSKSPVAQLVVVVGTPGEDDYESEFAKAAQSWQQVAQEQGIACQTIGLSAPDSETDFGLLRQAIESADKDLDLWLVLIGHGTFDGSKARFNLRGPDISATQLGDLLKPLGQRVFLINCASASSPFINRLSGNRRIIVTATKSGDQYNATRFGNFMGHAIGNLLNDLDKDGQVSLLEAFVAASMQTQEFYETEKRIATELALIDDNGDKQGTPANWFSGVRATKFPDKAKKPDGLFANQVFLVPSIAESKLGKTQRDARDRIELQLDSLRRKKVELGETEYLRQIEPLMVELARIYESSIYESSK